jgi:hypothetical protein
MLNTDLLGNNCKRIVKHSYFSYCVGIERQLRDVLHLHVITDRPLNFELLHRVWNAWSGWAWIDQINDRQGAAEYLTKYVLKGGEILTGLVPQPVYKIKPGRERPTWWIE